MKVYVWFEVGFTVTLPKVAKGKKLTVTQAMNRAEKSAKEVIKKRLAITGAKISWQGTEEK